MILYSPIFMLLSHSSFLFSVYFSPLLSSPIISSIPFSLFSALYFFVLFSLFLRHSRMSIYLDIRQTSLYPSLQNELLQAEQKNVLAQQDFHEMKNVSQAVSKMFVWLNVRSSVWLHSRHFLITALSPCPFIFSHIDVRHVHSHLYIYTHAHTKLCNL